MKVGTPVKFYTSLLILELTTEPLLPTCCGIKTSRGFSLEKSVMNLTTVNVVQSCHQDLINTMREMFIRISDDQWIRVTGAVKAHSTFL